jgi:aspartate-semialdehyde dehydrogenase
LVRAREVRLNVDDRPCLTEQAFRAAELVVFSNSKNYRRAPHVPLVVPLVNLDHLASAQTQREQHQPPLKKGYIVTNANCSTTGLVVPLKALEDAFGPLDAVHAVTFQAISGAGYPGVPSLDILDNIVPYIGGGEEEKMEWETGKILGGVDAAHESGFLHRGDALRVSATCCRVPVIDGHTESVSVRFARRPPPSPEQAKAALREFVSEAQRLGCPSAPKRAITVHEAENRPQPRLDRYDQVRGARWAPL